MYADLEGIWEFGKARQAIQYFIGSLTRSSPCLMMFEVFSVRSGRLLELGYPHWRWRKGVI
jgi:hypothetical protein